METFHVAVKHHSPVFPSVESCERSIGKKKYQGGGITELLADDVFGETVRANVFSSRKFLPKYLFSLWISGSGITLNAGMQCASLRKTGEKVLCRVPLHLLRIRNGFRNER